MVARNANTKFVHSATLVASLEAERAAKAYDLLIKGWNAVDIANELQYKSVAQVRRAIRKLERSQSDTAKETAKEVVDLEVRRVDYLWLEATKKIEHGVTPALLKTAVDILARKAKLLGLDKPTEHNVNLGMSKVEADNSSDIKLAIVLLQKCFVIHGENPLAIAQQAMLSLQEAGIQVDRQLPENCIEAELVEGDEEDD